ncbi:hypothetical protein AB0M54_36825 [Actinoplanes sp. NPDC051470]|uniref:hypothetical protein n=1 Tax=unclassified Actinoplanes TaxID=2626549 RepID=UPI0034198090
MDSSLALMVGFAACYAGGVSLPALVPRLGFQRAFLAAAGVVGGVALSFVLMLMLARVHVGLTEVVVLLFTGAVAYLVLRRDLSGRATVWASIGSAVLIGACFLFVSYLAVLAFIGAAGVYLLLRLFLRTRPALLLMGGTLGGLLAASAAVFAIALASM